MTNARSPKSAPHVTSPAPVALTPPLSDPPQRPIGRIPVQDVRPLVDQGRRPAKCVVGETFQVSAIVFREGHDAVNATVVLTNPDGVEQYLWVQTVTGLMIAVASWAVMVVVGLDNAVFWAFLIFIASYIPIIGGAIGILAPPLFALVQFETLWQAAVLLGVLQSIQFVVGNVILPRMQGDSLNIDPVAVLLALAFWGAIWGVPGMFLSTPLTVIAMVVCAQFEGSRWVAVLLSADGAPDKLRERRSVSDDAGGSASRKRED